MIAISDVIVGLVALIIGFTGGRISKPATRTPKNTMPPCSCGHTRGMHDQGRGSCQWSTWRTFGEYRDSCKCQIWDGPERPEDIIRDFHG